MDGLGIGIAGAGIGGLAAASLLADRGHRVTLFDQFEAPRPVGSGLVVQPVGLEVLHEIGAALRARQLGAPIARMRGLEARSGRTVLDVPLTAGVVGAALLPFWAAVGGVAALAARWTIVVEREAGPPAPIPY